MHAFRRLGLSLLIFLALFGVTVLSPPAASAAPEAQRHGGWVGNGHGIGHNWHAGWGPGRGIGFWGHAPIVVAALPPPIIPVPYSVPVPVAAPVAVPYTVPVPVAAPVTLPAYTAPSCGCQGP